MWWTDLDDPEVTEWRANKNSRIHAQNTYKQLNSTLTVSQAVLLLFSYSGVPVKLLQNLW